MRADMPYSDSADDGLVPVPPEVARLQKSASARPVSPVRIMAAAFAKQIGNTQTERMYSDVAAPSALYMTINPQYTIQKARELYGGEPRPLSGFHGQPEIRNDISDSAATILSFLGSSHCKSCAARHEFIRQAFLSDTEDWRSCAHIGSKSSAMAQMNVVAPEKSSYLAAAATRKISYYREKSLKRAVSYRAVLVKRDGTVAANQYSDQYFDKEAVQRVIKASMSIKRASPPGAEEAVRSELTKSLSSAPNRVLATSISKVVRPSTSGSAAGREGWSVVIVDDASERGLAADLGMSRAVGRIMSRSRTQNMRKSSTGVKFSTGGEVPEASWTVQDSEGEPAPSEPGPAFDDL